MSAIRRFKDWKIRRRYPKGSITFPVFARSRKVLMGADRREVKAVMSAFGFSELLLVHGSCNLVNGKVAIVSGPPGIGKSVASRKVAKQGHRQIEEGMLLLGKRGDKLFLVETGMQDLHKKYSRDANIIRRIVFLGEKNWDPEKTSVERRIRRQQNRLATLIAPINSKKFEPRLHQVGNICVAEHERYPNTPLRISDSLVVEEINDLKNQIPLGVKFTTFVPAGSRKGLVSKLQNVLLGK